VGKSGPKMWVSFSFSKKLPIVNNHSMGEIKHNLVTLLKIFDFRKTVGDQRNLYLPRMMFSIDQGPML
jgi:hypothetical protein